MTLEDTTLPFLAQDCRQAFGPTEGDTIYQQTEVRFQALLAQADDRGSPAIRDHLARKLLPPLAFYQVLRARGMDQAAALDQVRQETRQAAQNKKRDMASLTRLPFAYTLYRLGVKRYLAKSFPPAGWDTQWVRCDGKEIHFNLRTCLYQEVTQALGCPELCPLYCENDDIAFSGLAPKILFRRTGTLASGAPCCDFHFLRSR